MSKPRKSGQTKDNNISSKLLGANLSDINIEKFRDISQYKKQKYELAGKFTMPILKNITNKFSPLVIFTIVLPGQAIGNIEAIADCQNLMVLNLSRNTIDNISPLQKLKKLKIVDLSQNAITNLDALTNSKDLVNLHVEGNLIKSVDNLRGLKDCFNLKNIHLQTMSGNNQNPVCQLNKYKDNLLEMLPQVKRLDSIPISIVFNNGSEIKQTKKKDLKIELKSIGPFYTSKFPTVQQFSAPQFAEETSLKKSMANCKSSIQELQLKIRAMLTA